MSKDFIFPDPNDRSRNCPCVLVNSKNILDYYNLRNSEGEFKERVTFEIKDWFADEARKEGWGEIQFFNNQCLLTNMEMIKSFKG